MERKLFYAIDGKGKRVLIDQIIDRDAEYFCPFCKGKVIPKMGEKNVWHFSHVGESCLLGKSDVGADGDLSSFGEGVVDSSEIPFETDKFTCKICNSACSKENGVDLGNGWICKECYKNSGTDELKKYM